MRQVQIEFHTYSPHPYPQRVSARSLWCHHIRSSSASNVSPRVHVSLWTAMSQSWSAHPVFHSFPVLFACVLQCFLSPVGSFAIVNQRQDIAHKTEIIQNTLAAHTASLTLCVQSQDYVLLVSAKELLEKARGHAFTLIWIDPTVLEIR